METTLIYLRYTICTVICLVSMILTACFSLEFGSYSATENTIFGAVSITLLIIIGLVLDLSKYIFWGERLRVKGFTFLGITLVIFSWMASVAFFISNEEKKLAEFRHDTSEYTVYLEQIKSLNDQIAAKKEISIKRLDSKYHDQWDKSEVLLNEITNLEQIRDNLLSQESQIGVTEAEQGMVSTAFFKSVSYMIGADIVVVRNIFYAILALLIEVCALGLISLNRLDGRVKGDQPPSPPLRRPCDQNMVNHPTTSEKQPTKEPEQSNSNTEVTSQDEKLDEIRLVADIKSGIVPPVFNKLKDMNYDVSQVRIRAILKKLKNEGVLVDGRRRSLVLAQRQLSIVKTR